MSFELRFHFFQFWRYVEEATRKLKENLVTTSVSSSGSWRRYVNLPASLYFVLFLVFLAFFNTYFSGKTFSGKPVNIFVHGHAFLATLWLTMLASQALLIRQKKFALHRTVGRSSYVIAPLVVLSLILFSHYSLNRTGIPVTVFDSRVWVYDVGQVIGFSLAWGLAIFYRKTPALHMRFMISTVLAFGSAVIFRLLLNYFNWIPGLETFDGVVWANGIVLSFGALALVWIDWKKSIRPSPYLMIFSVNLLLTIGFHTLTKSSGWYSLALWFQQI